MWGLTRTFLRRCGTMFKSTALDGVSARFGRWRAPSSRMSRRSVLTGCVAVLGIVALIVVVRLSLPSLVERGWESLVPGASHDKAPPTKPDLASTRPSTATSSSAGSGSPVSHRPRVGVAAPSVAAGAGKPGGTTGGTTAGSGGEPGAAIPTPGPAAPPAAPAPTPNTPAGSGPSTPGSPGTGSTGSTPSVSIGADGGGVSANVDTGAGASVGVTVPTPDPSNPSQPTVTTSSVTTPSATAPPVTTPVVTTPTVTLPTVTLPGLP